MLSDELVELRAWRDADLPALAALRNDVALQAQLMTRPRPASEARVARWLADKSDRPELVFFIVSDRASGRAAGYLQYVGVERPDGIVELGVCIAEPFRGLGHAAAALALGQRYLRDVFAVRKITLQVLARNVRARRFFERCGFRDCGLWQAHVWHEGGWRDVSLMERLVEPVAHAGAGA